MNKGQLMDELDSIPLQELIARSAGGEENAFRVLVQRHQGYVYALAFRLVCDENDAEDIVQDTFIRVWRHLSSYDPRVRFTTWIYTIAVNLAYDRLKARKRRHWMIPLASAEEDASAGEDRVDERITNRDLARRIKEFADHLPVKQRLVFLLRDIQDFTVKEVAQTLEMSQNAVKANLCYARRSIRKKMERHNAAEGHTS
jgi:RNA polymerase sigma-70 factor, ECF subfamily